MSGKFQTTSSSLFTNKNVKGGFVFAQHKVDLGPL